MAAAKKPAPEAEAKEKAAVSVKPAAKVIDITHPGKTAPSASARPLIVTNRPIMEDPMMVTGTDSGAGETTGTPSGAPAIDNKMQTRPRSTKRIEPISKDMKIPVPGAIEKTTEDEESAGESLTVAVHDSIPEVKNPEAPEEPAPKTDEPEPTPAATRPAKPEEDDAANDEAAEAAAKTADEPATEESAPATEESAAEEAEKPAASDQATSDDTEDTTDEEAVAEDEESAEAKKAKQAEAETAEQKAHRAKIDKLVESKQYFLPINTVEKRRNARIAVGGFLLIVLMAVAWLDLAAEVGLVHLPYLPLTHLFSIK